MLMKMRQQHPIKIKPLLTWSPAHHIRRAHRLVKAPQFPIEKLSVTVVRLTKLRPIKILSFAY